MDPDPVRPVDSDPNEESPNKVVRPREVSTLGEWTKFQLVQYSKQHPELTQIQLVEWLWKNFHKRIHQSTVSRIYSPMNCMYHRLIISRHFNSTWQQFEEQDSTSTIS